MEGVRSPFVCQECGTAGVIFVPVDTDDPISGHPQVGSMRSAWLRAGLKRARMGVGAIL